jgi:hypothetical protein
MFTQDNKQKTPPRTKAGRTLLVKPSDASFDASVFEGLTGLTSKHHTEKSDSHFLVFATAQEALAALKTIKNKSGQSARIKFAQYRVFFKIEGLVDTTDYNTVKTNHTELVNKLTSNNQGGVLYYRLYRKDDKYIGSGDLTVDTKDVFDKLITDDGLKTFKGDGFSGSHYRYKKTDDENHHHHHHHQQSKAGDE